MSFYDRYQTGGFMLSCNRFVEAREQLIEFLEVQSSHEIPNKYTANALKNIGFCYKKEGNWNEALNYYKKELSIFQ